MPTIWTLGSPGKRKQFSYEGNVNQGVVLQFTGKPRIASNFFKAIHANFEGKRIPGGFNMDNPTEGGLGEWVRDNSGRLNTERLSSRHASFIAAILVNEGFVTNTLVGNAVYLQF
jgi:hypothetical protein